MNNTKPESKSELGIDTFCCYYTLTSKQAGKIIESLRKKPDFYTNQSDFLQDCYSYTSRYFVANGITLRVCKSGKAVPWSLYVVIHPAQLLGKTDRIGLYSPEKKSYNRLVQRIDKLLEGVKVPCSVDDMKLSRVDVTANLWFDSKEYVDMYLRVIKKAVLLPHYHLEWFRKGENKAKDCDEANRHSYKQQCKSGAYFAYDKVAQLSMIDSCSSQLADKHILRLEAQLYRSGMEKWVNKDDMGSNWKILEGLGEKAKKIHRWYLERMCPAGKYVRYEDAVEMVDGVKNKKTREHMRFLLRSTSDSHNLSNAMEKLGKCYNLDDRQIKHIMRKFEELDISPITLPNKSKVDSLAPLSVFF